MKHLCCASILLFLVLSISIFAKEPQNVAFYYGSSPAKTLFKSFDWVVVEPKHIKATKHGHESKLIAYFSVLERLGHDSFDHGWVAGRNDFWKSTIMDISDIGYLEDLKIKAKKLLEVYDGLFLDTIDSYNALDLSIEQKKGYEEGLVEFIKYCKDNFPDKIIVLNRGFEIFNRVKDSVDAVAVESIFSGLDLNSFEPKPVSKKDREWVLSKIKMVKNEGIPVIAIEYMKPPFNDALKLAKRVDELGLIPYITDPYLQSVGVGRVKPIPREVLIVYDKEHVDKSSAHRLYSLPLEYLGYVPKLLNIKEGLPYERLFDRYAGVIVAFEQKYIDNPKEFVEWVKRNIDDGVKFLFLDGFGFDDAELMKSLGLEVVQSDTVVNKKEIFFDKKYKFEIEPNVDFPSIYILSDSKAITKNITGFNAGKNSFSTAAYTDWGGFLLPGSSTVLLFDYALWAIDPFKFFKKGLNIVDIPVPDTTTKNGKRVLFVHIDGDGFIERAYFKNGEFSAEILYKEILNKYKIPHSISVIEGEIAPWGIYPKESKESISLAKKIFELEYVEPASHTFSHPYVWGKVENLEDVQSYDVAGYRFDIEGYDFSLDREILGSMEFVESISPRKIKEKMIFWSGDCRPSAEALKISYENSILNINGGDTIITEDNPWLVTISPMGVEKDGYFQVYAAIQNENIYTDEWRHYSGYKRVIETFKLTDKPKRLKPIDIYYHFYSASKKASLEALNNVYEWALAQNVSTVFASEWIKSVLDFRNIVVAKGLDEWSIFTDGSLKTVRLDYAPSIKKSKGVLGYVKNGDFYYVHLDNSKKYKISFEEDDGSLPYIEESNSEVDISKEGDWLFSSKVELNAKLYVPNGCRLVADGLSIKSIGNIKIVQSKDAGEFKIKAICSE